MSATQSISFWTLTNPPALVSLPMMPHPAGGAMFVEEAATGLSGPGAYFANVLSLTEDITMPDGGFVINLRVKHSFGGVNCVGGREAIEASIVLTAPTAPGNTNRNYVAAQLNATALSSDNGTSPLSHDTSAGQLFALGAFGLLKAGATSFLNVTAAEFDIAIEAGASAWYKSCIQLSTHPMDRVRGSVHDCLLAISGGGGGPAVRHTILVGDMNGGSPTDSSSTLFGTTGAGVAGYGLDFSTYDVAIPLRFKNFTFVNPSDGTPQLLNFAGNHARFYMGNAATVNFPALFFRSSGHPGTDYDSAIIAEGGDGTVGHGGLQFQAALAIGGPAGGFKGPGTINAQGVYDNGQRLVDLITALSARVAALEAHNPH